MEKGNYKTFVWMLVLSFIIMYGVMFLNVDQADHIYLSMTRLYMTLMMVASMALLMLAMMRMMFKNRKLNIIIILSSMAVVIFSLVGVRTQTLVSDVQYMWVFCGR